MEWIKFSDRKPDKHIRYLWAENNWDATNMEGEHVLRKGIRACFWNVKLQSFGTNGDMIDPDYWAEMPELDDAIIPDKYAEKLIGAGI